LFFWKFGMLQIRVAWAGSQVEIFSDMSRKAAASGAPEAVEYLEYVVGYYPSGTKQVSGSTLDRMVETSRARAIQEIIMHLRSKTGEDLGTNAEPWLLKFSRK
jgi:hypothetical protein